MQCAFDLSFKFINIHITYILALYNIYIIKDILISPFTFFWVKSGYNGAFGAT